MSGLAAALLDTAHALLRLLPASISGCLPTFLPRIDRHYSIGALSGESMIITRLNRSLAKQEPERSFVSPLGIVEEAMFTRGEKIATLDRWRRAILEELVAAGEVKRARLLNEIEEARSRLAGS